MAYEYVRKFYGVNPEPGMRVTSKGGKYAGVIVRKQAYDQYVHVRVDQDQTIHYGSKIIWLLVIVGRRP